MKRLCLTIWCLLCLLPSAVCAEGLLDKNVHYFWPAIDGSGLLLTYGSETLGLWRMHYGFYADDAVAPVNILTGDRLDTVVENQVSGNLLYAIGLFDVANIGFAFPFVFHRLINDDYDDLDLSPSVFEDIRIEAKYSFINRQRKCIGAALLARFTTPIAYEKNSFASDHGPTLEPVAIFDLGREWWTYAANLGYKHYFNPQDSDVYDLPVGDELTLNTGALFRVSPSQQVLLDSATRTKINSPFGQPDLDRAELMVAYRKFWQRLNFTALTAGVGVGLLSGVGDPKFRIFIGVTRDEKRLGPGDVQF
ncbi:MAG: hypothetical protein GX444_17720 [Myxococcales bacterium]|nr:hypothetical protein [Myxococcales bacterium]